MTTFCCASPAVLPSRTLSTTSARPDHLAVAILTGVLLAGGRQFQGSRTVGRPAVTMDHLHASLKMPSGAAGVAALAEVGHPMWNWHFDRLVNGKRARHA